MLVHTALSSPPSLLTPPLTPSIFTYSAFKLSSRQKIFLGYSCMNVRNSYLKLTKEKTFFCEKNIPRTTYHSILSFSVFEKHFPIIYDLFLISGFCVGLVPEQTGQVQKAGEAVAEGSFFPSCHSILQPR